MFQYSHEGNFTENAQDIYHRCDIKSPATRLFVEQLMRTQITETSMSELQALCEGISWWPVNFPHKGHWRGKSFHLMTSSWSGIFLFIYLLIYFYFYLFIYLFIYFFFGGGGGDKIMTKRLLIDKNIAKFKCFVTIYNTTQERHTQQILLFPT